MPNRHGPAAQTSGCGSEGLEGPETRWGEDTRRANWGQGRVGGAVRKGDRAPPHTSCPRPRGRQSRARASRAGSAGAADAPAPRAGQTLSPGAQDPIPGPVPPGQTLSPRAQDPIPGPVPSGQTLSPGAQDPIPGPAPPGQSPQANTVATCSPAATWGPWPRSPAASSAPPAPAWRSWRLWQGCRSWRCCWPQRWPQALLSPWRSAADTAGSGSTGPWRHAGHTQPPRRPPAARPAGPPAAAWSPRAERHELPRPQVTGQDPAPISHGSACPPQVAGLPCCARPHPFKGPGMGLPGVPEQTREEALTGPAHPGATAHTLHVHVSVSQVTHARFKR